MAGMINFVCFMLLALIALSALQTTPVSGTEILRGHHKHRYGPGSLKSHQCTGECLRRCSQTSHHKPCMYFCEKCCATCLCVPPGFYGNKGLCPCYNNWKTQEGKPKCP